MDDLLGQQVAIVIDEGDVVEGPGQEGKLEPQSTGHLRRGDSQDTPAAAQLALGNSGSAVGRSLTDKEQCAILEAWCIDHIGFPYPTAEEREQLESATRMGEKQMKDWFNNVRKRKIIP
ncbi:hypothetical protein M885DRAFT_498149 [Pelagophyceae sp. CCMP2097]|nr:hypothetical protein M885DRAFT_498149 [Pelagophyceae sp. CCMP2097]